MQYIFTSIMAILIFITNNVNRYLKIVKIYNFSLFILFKILIIAGFILVLLIFVFYLVILTKHFFVLDCFFNNFKKLSNFLTKPLLKIWSYIIFCQLVLNFVLVNIVGINLIKIRNVRALKFIQYLGKNMIKLLIIFIKTLYFFIQKQFKIIK